MAGEKGHKNAIEISITDIMDKGDPRQPLPEEKKKNKKGQSSQEVDEKPQVDSLLN